MKAIKDTNNKRIKKDDVLKHLENGEMKPYFQKEEVTDDGTK